MPAGRDGSLVEGVHGSTVFAGERDVDGSAHFTLPDPEIRLSRLSEAHSRDVVLQDQLVAQRRQRFLVEVLTPFEVRHRKANVIKHRSPPAIYQSQPTFVRRSIPMTRSFATANVRKHTKAQFVELVY
jgi:hypothetical protein